MRVALRKVLISLPRWQGAFSLLAKRTNRNEKGRRSSGPASLVSSGGASVIERYLWELPEGR